MFLFIVALFLALHGLVHLLYVGQSRRLFELQSGMVWPDGSWALSRLVGDETTRGVASLLLIVAAAGFVAAGLGVLMRQEWWRAAAVGAAAFSTIVYILLWDGGWQQLDDKGAVGLLINLAIAIALLGFNWPRFAF
jgi:hypothetical protein